MFSNLHSSFVLPHFPCNSNPSAAAALSDQAHVAADPARLARPARLFRFAPSVRSVTATHATVLVFQLAVEFEFLAAARQREWRRAEGRDTGAGGGTLGGFAFQKSLNSNFALHPVFFLFCYFSVKVLCLIFCLVFVLSLSLSLTPPLTLLCISCFISPSSTDSHTHAHTGARSCATPAVADAADHCLHFAAPFGADRASAGTPAHRGTRV
jgi:hypothetical protein